jgi:hypothetical protein
MDNGVDDEGDGATDDDGDNGDGATDDNVGEDGDGDGATDDDGDGDVDGDGATDDDDDDDDDGNDSDGAAADDNNVDDNDKDVDHVNVNNLPPRVGKRNDGCDETKTEEEETVTDSVACGDTHNNQTDHGEGGW